MRQHQKTLRSLHSRAPYPSAYWVAMFLLGGLMMLAMLPVSAGLNFIGIEPNTFLRPFIVPPVEETFKLAPVLLVLWIHRKAGTLLLGISDVMLLSGFCGAGFNLVEEAYRLAQTPAQYLWWLPSAQVVGEVYAHPSVIAGHAIWAMLAGIAIGFASLFRRGGIAMYAVGLFGVALATFDHLANNYWSPFGGSRHPDLLSQFLQFVDLRGWLAVWLFVLAVVGSIAVDTFLTRAALASSLATFGEILRSKSKQALDKLIWQRRQAYLDFRSRQRLFITAVLAIIAVALSLSSFPKMRAQQGGTGDNKAIDLTGKWKSDDGDEVFISQNGQTVMAAYPVSAPGEACPWGLTKDFYFKGSLSGNTLTGTMKRCTRDERLVKDCKLSDPYDAKIIETTVDQNTITGKYVPDYINYDNDYKSGHYINCVLHPGAGRPTGFELTRECGDNDARRQHPSSSSDVCKPDHFKGCQDIAVANKAFQEIGFPALVKGDFSYKTMEHLKELLDPRLDDFRADFCDNSSARERTAKIMDELDDLLCEGGILKRDRLLHDIKKRLADLALEVCGSRAPW